MTDNYKFEHIPFPSIPQYRHVIKQIQQSAKHHSVPAPTVTFKGSVKLHGTNAAVVLGLDGEVYAQSRERVIDPLSDNAGFATQGFFWGTMTDQKYSDLTEVVERMTKSYESDSDYVFVYNGNY